MFVITELGQQSIYTDQQLAVENYLDERKKFKLTLQPRSIEFKNRSYKSNYNEKNAIQQL